MAANAGNPSLTANSNGVFSIHGKGLKLTSRQDAEPYVAALREMEDQVREIHLGGNTLGVEACQAIAEVVKTKSKLEVGRWMPIHTF